MKDTAGLPGDEEQADMYLQTVEFLKQYGYEQYEISNFAKPGRESRHNLKYWKLQEYAGFGPGAHSDFGGVRYAYEKDLDAYIAAAHGGQFRFSENTVIPPRDRDVEWVMLGSRTVYGLDPKEYENRFRRRFDPIFLPFLQKCVAAGYAVSQAAMGDIVVTMPQATEQEKLSKFISLLDDRIATQNKIIEDLKILKSAIAERLFNSTDGDILSLSDVCIIQKGKQVNGEDLSETGKFYVMNGGVEPSGYYDQCNTPANTISISEGGNSCGYIQYNRDAFWSGGHCYTLNNIQPNVCKLYLYHYLKSQESSIMKLRIGTGLPNIQKKDLEKFHILLTSKAIQESISAFLTTIDRKITNEDMLLQRFQKGKQYLLRQMFI